MTADRLRISLWQCVSVADDVEENLERLERAAGDAAARFAGEQQGMTYSRLQNPTVEMLEHRIALLEGAEACRTMASGMAAMTAVLLSQLQTHMPIARDQMKQQAATPMLLVMPQVRPLLARYARLFAPGLHVLSYNEIPEQREVNVVGSLG